MSNHSTHKTEEKHEEEASSGNAFFDGIKILFGGAAHQFMKGIHFFDTVKSMVKTSGGSFAMASGTTELDVEFNETATLAEVTGDAEARKIEAEGEAEAAKLEADGDAEESRSHQFTTNMPRTLRKKNRN